MKNIFVLYLLNEKTEFILSSKIKCPKSGIFTNNYWVGLVRQSNFASKHSSVFGHCRKNFRARMDKPPRKKLARTPMHNLTYNPLSHLDGTIIYECRVNHCEDHREPWDRRDSKDVQVRSLTLQEEKSSTSSAIRFLSPLILSALVDNKGLVIYLILGLHC